MMGLVPGASSIKTVSFRVCSSRNSPGAVTATVSVEVILGCWAGSVAVGPVAVAVGTAADGCCADATAAVNSTINAKLERKRARVMGLPLVQNWVGGVGRTDGNDAYFSGPYPGSFATHKVMAHRGPSLRRTLLRTKMDTVSRFKRALGNVD